MQIHCTYDAIETVNKLKVHPKNRNEHSDEQIARLADILKFQGWRYPIKVSNQSGFITSGHGRLLASKLNKWDEVPVSYQNYENEDQEYADLISDNAIASWAELDFDAIKVDFAALSPDFDIDLLGIKDFEISLEDDEKESEVGEDEIPEVPENPKTKPGDLFRLGKHILLCGDSTNLVDVNRLMNGEVAELCFTSPPYADQRTYEDKSELTTTHLATFISTAAESCNYFAINLGYSRKDFEVNQYWDDYISEAKNCGLKFLSWNIWDRATPATIGQQTAMFPVEHEWIFVFGKDKKKLNPTIENKWGGTPIHGTLREKDGTRSPSRNEKVNSHRAIGTIHRGDIARYVGDDEAHKHPAIFPIHLPTAYIEAMTSPGDSVFEPFSGSGTTFLACHQLDRKCHGMEINPAYCDIILDRWKKLTGEDPIHESGKLWSEVKNAI